jgi:hypothetical protein
MAHAWLDYCGHLSCALCCYSCLLLKLRTRRPRLAPLQVPFQAIVCCAFLVHTPYRKKRNVGIVHVDALVITKILYNRGTSDKVKQYTSG